MVASGALAFDGQGWLWEKPLIRAGIIKPELFTTVIKTLTLNSRPGNLRWWKPWECVRLIPGGSVNKVGLTNPGIRWWCKKVAPRLNFHRFPLVGSIFGEENELVMMAHMLNRFNLVGLEVNDSCPNTGHAMQTTRAVVDSTSAVRHVSRHPVIVKVSVAQDYIAIAAGLAGIASAISLNSVPWEMVFPDEDSPLWRLQKKVGGGGGGVSGKPAQEFNWEAVRRLSNQGALPVIGPDIMEFEDLDRVKELGAQAVSFGAIHLRKPWKPTVFVQRELRERFVF